MTLWMLYRVKLYLLLVLYFVFLKIIIFLLCMHTFLQSSSNFPHMLPHCFHSLICNCPINLNIPILVFCFVFLFCLEVILLELSFWSSLNNLIPGWLHSWCMGSSLDYHPGKSFCGFLGLTSHFLQPLAPYVIIFFSIYFPKKRHISYKIF